MPFPEFEPGKRRILFFSRGRGRGHAVPDHAILQALGAMRQDLDVRVVSYGTGAAVFSELGAPHIDLGLPESGPIIELSVLAGKLTGWLNPELVVSHEEFAVLPAAKIFGKPTLMFTDWFTEPELYSMGSLKFADRVLFLGSPGVFPEPPWVSGKIAYLGWILRDFRYRAGDKPRARSDLGISAAGTVIAVFPGSWREPDTPVLDAVRGAAKDLDARLIWVAGGDFDLIRERAPEAEVVRSTAEIDKYMAAADVAITKSNRKTVYELRYLETPTIAVSFALNPSDDQAVAAIPEVVRMDGASLTASALRASIESLLAEQPRFGPPPRYCRAADCANLISEALDAATRAPSAG